MMYLAVTPDKLELPLAVACSVQELSRITGVSCNTISSSIFHNRSGKRLNMKFVRVEDNE